MVIIDTVATIGIIGQVAQKLRSFSSRAVNEPAGVVLALAEDRRFSSRHPKRPEYRVEHSTPWRQCFQKWPKDVPQRGVLVTNFQEQIAFEGFMASDTMLIVERKAPDTVGAQGALALRTRVGCQIRRRGARQVV